VGNREQTLFSRLPWTKGRGEKKGEGGVEWLKQKRNEERGTTDLGTGEGGTYHSRLTEFWQQLTAAALAEPSARSAVARKESCMITPLTREEDVTGEMSKQKRLD
jgi:hypothetical protein